MLFKSTTLALLAASCVSAMSPNAGIPADSKAGRNLLSQARMLDQQDEDDMTWMTGYSIKYLGCSALVQVREEGGNAEEGESNLYTMNLVKFALCPSTSSCSSCGNGKAQYVVNMETFVNAYTEMQMNAQEQACENIRENCDCDNANDEDACQNQCYYNMGMDSCVEMDGDEEFDAQEYLECKELEGANNNNNNNNGNYNNNNNNNNGVNMYLQYFVGPVCSSNGFDINLATFYDNGCTKQTKSGVYEAFSYGASLPYEKESMVKGDCISCEQVDDDNNNNNNNGDDDAEPEVAEICENAAEEAAKCESGLSGVKSYPDESGCDYINNILPKLVKSSKSVAKYTKNSNGSGSSGGSAAVGWCIFFALTAIIMSAYAFFLYRKIHRAKVNLSAAEGATMA